MSTHAPSSGFSHFFLFLLHDFQISQHCICSIRVNLTAADFFKFFFHKNRDDQNRVYDVAPYLLLRPKKKLFVSCKAVTLP